MNPQPAEQVPGCGFIPVRKMDVPAAIGKPSEQQ
jgi:hypothetical protein